MVFRDGFKHKENAGGPLGAKHPAEIARLSQAACGRTPETAGLAAWAGVLASGASPMSVASSLAGAAEFASLFAGLSPAAAVSQFYENTFHSAGDPNGVSYWTGQIQNGTPMGGILLSFADSLQNRVATAGATHDGWVYATA